MGKTALFDAFAQSDLDMAGFHILNCPDLASEVGPTNFPPVPNQWINQYNAATGTFGAARPNTLNLGDWPSPIAGMYLQAVTGGYRWTPAATGGFTGYLNVKSPPYNCVGDGVADDTLGIEQALDDAAGTQMPGHPPPTIPGPPLPPAPNAGGLTVYFPKGTYRITAGLAPQGPVSMLGDSPWSSVIKMDVGALPAGPILNLSAAGGSMIQSLGFSGDSYSAAAGATIPVRHGIFAVGANSITINNCLVFFCLGIGMVFEYCYYVNVRNCIVAYCGSFGIATFFCPRSIIYGNTVGSTQESGIGVVNGQATTINGNQLYSCCPYGYGILVSDSDNSAITGNLVQQSAVGVFLGTSQTRALNPNWDAFFSYGYTFCGNTICRNYYGGVQIAYSHGFKVTGNVITDNGQGASDNVHGWTIEPGLMVPLTGGGSGYQVGDVVTLDPANGVGTPAKAIVTRITTAGAIWPEGLLPLSLGAYTVWPTNPVNLTGGHGTGGKCLYSGSRILSGGTGYSVGQAVRHNLGAGSGAYYNPVRLMITSVGAGGAVTGYTVIDGGGYLVNTYTTLPMIGDAYSPQNGPINGLGGNLVDPGADTGTGPAAGLDYPDLPDAGTGFTISAAWALRYSSIYNSGAGTTFNLSTYHLINGGVVSGNIIDHCGSGCGYLNLGSSQADRAGYLMFSGNMLIANAHPLEGGTVATGGVITLDNNYVLNGSIFQTDINVSGTHYYSPLNKIV